MGTTSSGSRRGSSQRAEPDAEGRGNRSQRLGRSSGAPPAGRELRGEGSSAAGSQHPLSPTHSRAGSLNSGGLDWLGVAGEPAAGQRRAPMRAGAGCKAQLREFAGSWPAAQPGIWPLHLPTPTQTPSPLPVLYNLWPLRQNANLLRVLGEDQGHSAGTCSPLGVGVVLGNWTCDSQSGFQ